MLPDNVVTAAPVYWDYQAGVNRVVPGGKLSLFAFGSNDTLKVISNDPRQDTGDRVVLAVRQLPREIVDFGKDVRSRHASRKAADQPGDEVKVVGGVLSCSLKRSDSVSAVKADRQQHQ